jgi:hypothetical protein
MLLALTGLCTIEITKTDVSDMRINGNSEVLLFREKGKLEKDEFAKISPEIAETIRVIYLIRDNSKVVENTKVRALFGSCSDRSAGQRITIRSIR